MCVIQDAEVPPEINTDKYVVFQIKAKGKTLIRVLHHLFPSSPPLIMIRISYTPHEFTMDGIVVSKVDDAGYSATYDIDPASNSPSTTPFYPDTPPLSSVSSETDLSLKLSTSTVSPTDEPLVAVIGVGYVGTHLVGSFSSRYRVIGFDVSERRIRDLRQGIRGNEAISFSRDQSDLVPATHFLISVPTLLRPDKTIDSSYLCDALKMVGKVARRGSTVVIESSVAVGMTRQLLGPLAMSKGLFAGMSPEVSHENTPLFALKHVTNVSAIACRSRSHRASRPIHPQDRLRP
jgi:hypothetical protein